MLLAIRDDLREAFRRLGRNPRLTLTAVCTLALGIGATTAVFTMAHTVLYAPPPFRAPDRLVALVGRRPGYTNAGVSGADLKDYRAERGLFDAAAFTSYAEFSWTGQSLPGFDGAEVLRGLNVTGEYFDVFDQPMAIGRGFPNDEARGDRAVVIAYSLWQRRFGGRPDVLGATLTLNGNAYTVVGVAGARRLTYEPYEVLAWVPMAVQSDRRNARMYSCYARLSPRVSLEQAQARADAVSGRLGRAFPSTNEHYSLSVEPLLADLHEQARPAMIALAAAVACLLLIAAANVASLLLARATVDAREMAIRAALGAGRLRLFRTMVAQGLMLALLASVGGLLIAASLLIAAKSLMPASLQYDWAFVLDARVFVISFLVAAVAGLIAGLAPGFESFRLAVGGLRPSVHASRLLKTIVTAEIALAVFLSVGAGLLAKSFSALVNRPLGYQTEHLLGMRVRLEGDRYRTRELRGNYWAQLVERVGALPGVQKAASVSDLPMGWQYIGGEFDVEGRAWQPGEHQPIAHYLGASPGYFATVGIPVLRGRGFTEADTPASEPVAIVSDFFAEKFWPGQNPLGRMVKAGGGDWRRIVGVARRIRHGGPADEYQDEIYMPLPQFNLNTMFLVLRSALPPESLVPSIRGVLKTLDPNVPAFEIRTLDQAFTREIAGPRLPVALTTVFAALAMALAGVGLFGVIGYWVSRRVTEMGVRSAVGARPAELRALVLWQGARLMAVGLVLGVAAALATMRFLRSLLYGMTERDPAVYAASIALTVVVTLLACWLPAVRASRVDPATALREE